MRRLVLLGVFLVPLLVVGRAAGQAQQPKLALMAPGNGDTTGPDVTVVVGLTAPAAQRITFVVLLDQAPALLENPTNGQTSRTAPVAAGGRTSVILRGVPEGTHTLQAVAVPAAAAVASARTSFSVSARGFNLVLLLASVGVLIAFVAYRRRILRPWAERYERGPDGAGSADSPDAR